MYPFSPRSLRLPAGTMRYVDAGSGRPVVMVHGNPTWSFLYRHLIGSLRGRCRCVAPDHLGFGLSDKPPDWSYLPREHARNFTALVGHLGLEQITLVVQDWGGPIGLSYAIEHPDNLRALVILNTWMWPVERNLRFVSFSRLMGSRPGRIGITRLNLFVRLLLPLWFGRRTNLTPAVHRHYLMPMQDPADRKGMWIFPREILGSTAWLEELWTRRRRLEGIPKLIVWGGRDMAFRGEELRHWVRTFPRSRVVRIPHAGHFVQEEAPEKLAQAVKTFLECTFP